jgi:UDP-N-acetylmuramyl pentapeptide phosphotransferase/UDP-N-acetylglucosamine-1-phosphate transferase
MLNNYFLSLKESITVFNLFEYITFRAALAAITALILSFIIGPFIIRKLKNNQIGEEIRNNGPMTHYVKRGTPTMGGVIIILAALLPTLMFSNLDNTMIRIVIISTIWMGVIGFIDDYLKVIKKIEKGMIARYKMIGQITLGILISYWIISSNDFMAFNTKTTVPFLKNIEIDLGYMYPLLVILLSVQPLML